MKITFDNALYTDSGYKNIANEPQKAVANTAGGYQLDISDSRVLSAYSFGKSKGLNGISKEELMQIAGGQDMTLYRNYMTVMSNTMSDEDFIKMQEEGYHPMEMHPEDACNILDTIKVQLLKAGVDVAGYTDTVDKEVLEDITGSVTYADRLLASFAKEDVPFSEENVKSAVLAIERGLELDKLNDGAVKFLLTNAMPPTIDNLYLAKHSGAGDGGKQAKGYFMEDMPGYLAKTAKAEDTSALKEQIEKVIEKAGFPVQDDTMEEGLWLVEKGVPITEETFRSFHELRELVLPAKENSLIASVVSALAEGKDAGSANLLEDKSIYKRAVDFYEAHRSMEEIRLHMTVEANLKLLKSGFSIDTAPIEETIEALKSLEQEQVSSSKANVAELCKETIDKVKQIPYLPAQTTGRLLFLNEKFTIDTVYETGKQLQAELEAANKAYETMFTEIRGDLGDSLKKAFASVDNLLTNMGIELTADSRKAARSLAYNNMELTPENIRKVEEAEGALRKVVKKMTPMSVLQMIRDQINPLKASLEELNTYLESQDSYAEDSEKYSRFLYRMEQAHEISDEEKESFIGIYRLLHQIEKSDGAAVGKLVDTGAELNFKNLLTAVRCGKLSGIDIVADKEFGGLKEAIAANASIDAQIDSAYNKELLQKIRGMEKTDYELFSMLEKLEEPVTLENLALLRNALEEDSDLYKKIKKYEDLQKEEESILSSISGEAFADKNHFLESYQNMLKEGKNLLKEKTFTETLSSVDVRSLRLSCKEISIKQKLAAKEEEYRLPLLMEDKVVDLHVKFLHDTKDKGSFTVRFQDENMGEITGQFTMKENTLSGYFASETEEVGNLLQVEKLLSDRLDKAGIKTGDFKWIIGKISEQTHIPGKTDVETSSLYKAAGAVIYACKETLTGNR